RCDEEERPLRGHLRQDAEGLALQAARARARQGPAGKLLHRRCLSNGRCAWTGKRRQETVESAVTDQRSDARAQSGRRRSATPGGDVQHVRWEVAMVGWTRFLGTTLIVSLLAWAAARGQNTPTGEILSSSGVISPIVADYDRSLQFYHGLLGLEAPAPRIASA